MFGWFRQSRQAKPHHLPAPWRRYPERHSAAAFWRDGEGQAYLDDWLTRVWITLGLEAQRRYVEEHSAPRDWQQVLLHAPASAAGTAASSP